MNELTQINRKQMYVSSVHSLVSGVLTLNFEVWAAEDTPPVLKSVSCEADGCRYKGPCVSWRLLVLEGQRLFQGSTTAGVWHHHSITDTCLTLYNVKFTAIGATISFKSMSGKKEGFWNPVPVGVFDEQVLLKWVGL